MKKIKIKTKPRYSIENCGGKKGGKSCTWAGATKGQTTIKVAA